MYTYTQGFAGKFDNAHKSKLYMYLNNFTIENRIYVRYTSTQVKKILKLMYVRRCSFVRTYISEIER